MGNIDNSKIIRIYGVTLAESGGRTRPYGHGRTKFKSEDNKGIEMFVDYVDYYIDDLIALIKKEKLEKVFLKKLGEE